MPTPRKYPTELRERATRLTLAARRDPAAPQGAVTRIASQLDIHPEALRSWVTRAETDAGIRPGLTTSDETRLKELERENRELRRANEIFRTASAFFATELDRPSR